MQEIGWVGLGVIPTFDAKKLDRDVDKAMLAAGDAGGRRFGDAAGKSASSRFGSIVKKGAKAALFGVVGLATAGVALLGSSVQAASDLEESTNKVDQIFGDAAKSIFRFSKRAADALGQTNTQAREAASTFGTFGKAAGFSDRQNAKFAKRMTRLASDLASFSNTEPDEAIQALGAALRGESEPIRKYGVLLDEATLKAEAMNLGILKPVKNKAQIQAYQVSLVEKQREYNEAVKENGKNSLEAQKAEAAVGTARDKLKKATEGTIGPLTQQQKLLAAQSQIFKQTSDAQGDFERTSGGLANQQRRLKARFEDAKAELGKGLLPIMTDAADFLLDKGLPAFEDFAEWFRKSGIPKLKDFGGKVKTAAGHVKDLVGWMSDLPGNAKMAGVLALVGGIGAMKLRGGKGALGSVGGALGLAKPVPVFVTNPGFGTGGGGGGKGPGGGVVPGGAPKPGTLPKFAPFIPIGLSSAPGQDSLLHELTGFGPKGSGGAFDPKDVKDAAEFQKVLTGEVEKTRVTWLHTKEAVEEYSRYVQQRVPREIHTTVTGWDVANDRARNYLETLLQIRSMHFDINGEGLGGTNPPNRSPQRTPAPAQTNPRGGVFIASQTVVAHDYKDFVQQSQRRSIAAAGEGMPRR